MRERNGINQSYARMYNNQLVIEKLREKPLSGTLIAEELNLSNASVSSIIKDLLELNLIKIDRSESIAKVGRKQVYYAINDEFGLFIVVSLSDKKLRVVVSNSKEENLLDRKKEIEKYDLSTIYEIILDLKSMINKSEYKNIPVKSIVISIPGRVNFKTKELQLSKQFDSDLFKEENTIVHLFEKYFSCKTSIMNDIAIEVLGEQAKGLLNGKENALLVHIDEGVGSSFILNGKPYLGELGYAGELGLIRAHYNDKEDYLDEFISLRAIRNKLNIKTTQDLIEQFKTDEKVRKEVLATAHLLGHKLKDIQELLNLSTIILTGRIERFGEDYINCVKEEMNMAFAKCEIEYSILKTDAVVIGGVNKAVNDLLMDDYLFQK